MPLPFVLFRLIVSIMEMKDMRESLKVGIDGFDESILQRLYARVMALGFGGLAGDSTWESFIIGEDDLIEVYDSEGSKVNQSDDIIQLEYHLESDQYRPVGQVHLDAKAEYDLAGTLKALTILGYGGPLGTIKVQVWIDDAEPVVLAIPVDPDANELLVLRTLRAFFTDGHFFSFKDFEIIY